MPTHIVGGVNFHKYSHALVTRDPFSPHAGPDISKKKHFQDHVPPLFDKDRAANVHTHARAAGGGALNATMFGAKRRFGASFGAMPPQKRGPYGPRDYFEDEYSLDADTSMDDTLNQDPWGTGAMFGMEVSKAFRDRFAQTARAETDAVRRCIKLAFLGQRVCHASFARILANNDVFPFGFLLLRPYMTYTMASAILTVSGSATGETLVGHADFQLADNVVQKMHIGNFTMYLKSVVYQPHHVWIADNVMATGYVGGNNCDFRRDPANLAPPADATHPSLFSCLVPYDCTQEGQGQTWENELPNPLDITGRYSSNPALTMLNNTVRNNHYATAPFYSSRYNWDNSDQNMNDDSYGTSNRYNTLCFAGHYMMYNIQTQRYDLVHTNTGHRGDRIYAGCGRVWKGLAKLLEPVNYNTAHGGAPVRSLVTNSV